jgi:GT2 family glycosyltransferase
MLKNTPALAERELAVIIPTHNRRSMLLETLGALMRQTLRPDRFEVVVMCDGCTDGTYEAVSALNPSFRLRVFAHPQAGVAATRNFGVGHATARIVLFLDDDISAVPELLAEHVRLHDGRDDRVVIGRLLPDPSVRSKGWTRWEQEIFDGRYDALEREQMPVDGRKFYTGNVSMARATFLAAGGFNVAFRRAEDIELGYRLQRAGAEFLFNSRAAGVHRGVHSFDGWSRTQYNYGRYDVRLAMLEGYGALIPVAAWFRQRNILNRFLSRAAIGRPVARRVALATARAAAVLSDGARLPRPSRWSYSAIANLHYWQGVADELGGASRLWELVRTQQPTGHTAEHIQHV